MRSEDFANHSNNNLMPRQKRKEFGPLKSFWAAKKKLVMLIVVHFSKMSLCAKTKEKLSESFSTDAEPNTHYLVLQEHTCKLSR